jgi:hypothetical protein
MWVIGDTALLVWVDIDAEHTVAFNEWYDREHMRDRVIGIPGYRVGRRFTATDAAPAHLAIYECRPGVLESAAYRELVGNPDPRTRHFVPLMHNATRAVTKVTSRFGEAEGSTLGTLTLAAAPGREGTLREFVAEKLLPELASMRGIIAGALLEAVAESSNNTGVSTLRRSGRTIAWVIALESRDPLELASAIESARVVARLITNGAKNTCATATYRMTYRVSPRESDA